MVNIMTAAEYYNLNLDQLLQELNKAAESHYRNIYDAEKKLNAIIVQKAQAKDHYVVQFNIEDLKYVVSGTTLYCKERQNEDLVQYAELYFPNIKAVELFVRESKLLLEIMMNWFDSQELE